MSVSWRPMLVAWIAKTGLLLGDYCIGTAWPIVGWITGRSLYSFQQ